MAERRDAEAYRACAHQWQADADCLPNGAERELCLVLAKGYGDLACIRELTGLSDSPPPCLGEA